MKQHTDYQHDIKQDIRQSPKGTLALLYTPDEKIRITRCNNGTHPVNYKPERIGESD
ncbi:hypothetical protein [Mediterranea sp. An20]|uniref:hypothetical protein n=1 Tax=Mediterranea sp. An20 TaxID=1965586 RepID=UPI0013A65275|nr:hypothetical protein [Mediterranea sp. An20]